MPLIPKIKSILKSKKKVEKWQYFSHIYLGLSDGSHVYHVEVIRGPEKDTKVFHAEIKDPSHDIAFFRKLIQDWE